MKKIFLTLTTVLGICAGTHSLKTNSAAAQMSAAASAVNFTPIPLTNQIAFTNTLVLPTNGATFQLGDVLALLLTLQTNIEQTLPVLDFIQSNAAVVSVSSTNVIQGFAAPMTSIPDPLGVNLTPTGAASGTTRQQVTSLSVRIGTNDFNVDAATLQAIFILRNDLGRSLPVLQSLNGTTAPPTNRLVSPPAFFNPSVTNFSPGPLTNNLRIPLNNNITPF